MHADTSHARRSPAGPHRAKVTLSRSFDRKGLGITFFHSTLHGLVSSADARFLRTFARTPIAALVHNPCLETVASLLVDLKVKMPVSKLVKRAFVTPPASAILRDS